MEVVIRTYSFIQVLTFTTAVQDERQKHNSNAEEDVLNEINKEMPVEKILEAETMSDQKNSDNDELSVS